MDLITFPHSSHQSFCSCATTCAPWGAGVLDEAFHTGDNVQPVSTLHNVDVKSDAEQMRHFLLKCVCVLVQCWWCCPMSKQMLLIGGILLYCSCINQSVKAKLNLQFCMERLCFMLSAFKGILYPTNSKTLVNQWYFRLILTVDWSKGSVARGLPRSQVQRW